MALTLGGQYVLEEQIGFGGCGTVFHGTHRLAGKSVAIKVEPVTERDIGSPLRQESRIYKTLMGGPGVPWIMWSGKTGDYNVIVIDRLGKDLDRLFKMCNRHFTLKTVLMLADQLITRLEYIHSRGLTHRDVKPANFVLGTGKAAGTVNVIDFGLARRFRDPRTNEHVPYSQTESHGTGTSLFASLNTHDGIECSRRDDLESLAYMLIYFMRGQLPWSHINGASDDETWALIRAAKLEFQSVLTVGLPTEFDALFRYARALEFADAPDYAGLRGLFAGLARRKRIELDGRFDWGARKPPPKRRHCEACKRKHHSA